MNLALLEIFLISGTALLAYVDVNKSHLAITSSFITTLGNGINSGIGKLYKYGIYA